MLVCKKTEQLSFLIVKLLVFMNYKMVKFSKAIHGYETLVLLLTLFCYLSAKDVFWLNNLKTSANLNQFIDIERQ